MYQNGNFPRFVGCVRMPGYFGGACANCIWSDHTARCSSYDEDDNTNPAPPPPPPASRRGPTTPSGSSSDLLKDQSASLQSPAAGRRRS
jgi:Protein of unknown function (DUF3716)